MEVTLFRDQDRNGFTVADSTEICGGEPGEGWAEVASERVDCDDLRADVNPDGIEIPGDRIDQNCDREYVLPTDDDGIFAVGGESEGGDGTMANPYSSLDQALRHEWPETETRNIYLSGEFYEDGEPELETVNLYGGFDSEFTTWTENTLIELENEFWFYGGVLLANIDFHNTSLVIGGSTTATNVSLTTDYADGPPLAVVVEGTVSFFDSKAGMGSIGFEVGGDGSLRLARTHINRAERRSEGGHAYEVLGIDAKGNLVMVDSSITIEFGDEDGPEELLGVFAENARILLENTDISVGGAGDFQEAVHGHAAHLTIRGGTYDIGPANRARGVESHPGEKSDEDAPPTSVTDLGVNVSSSYDHDTWGLSFERSDATLRNVEVNVVHPESFEPDEHASAEYSAVYSEGSDLFIYGGDFDGDWVWDDEQFTIYSDDGGETMIVDAIIGGNNGFDEEYSEDSGAVYVVEGSLTMVNNWVTGSTDNEYYSTAVWFEGTGSFYGLYNLIDAGTGEYENYGLYLDDYGDVYQAYFNTVIGDSEPDSDNEEWCGLAYLGDADEGAFIFHNNIFSTENDFVFVYDNRDYAEETEPNIESLLAFSACSWAGCTSVDSNLVTDPMFDFEGSVAMLQDDSPAIDAGADRATLGADPNNCGVWGGYGGLPYGDGVDIGAFEWLYADYEGETHRELPPRVEP